MDSRSNVASTNENYGDFTGTTQPTQQQQESGGFSGHQETQPTTAPHHHLHKDNEPIGQKQYDPSAAAGFGEANVEELSSNQTTDYHDRPNAQFDEDPDRDQERTTHTGAGDEQQQKGGVGARLTGKLEQMTGKYTHNPLKEAAGLEKQSGATKDPTKADVLEQQAQDVRFRAAGGNSV